MSVVAFMRLAILFALMLASTGCILGSDGRRARRVADSGAGIDGGTDVGPLPDAGASVCGDGQVTGNEVCDGEPECASDCLSVFVSGAISSTDGVWARNSSSCTAGSGEYYFDTESFVWRGEARSVRFRVDWDGFDGYLHAFEAPFNPASPETGCLDADDDDGGTSGSAVTLELSPGDRIDLVLSTFSAGSTGGWSLTITPAS